MSTAKRQPDPRRAQTREALLQAAEAALRETPIDELSVAEIARQAGVAVTSIYNHFGSKAGLQAALAERAMDVDRQYMDRAYVDRRSPVEQLQSAAAEYLQFYLDYPDYFRLLAFPPEPGRNPAGQELNEQIARRVDEQNARMVKALQQAIDAGLVRKANARELATILWSAWNGMISLGWRADGLRKNEKQLRKMVTLATDIITAGLLKPPG
ncbi:TetR family transcriptional regulator [Solimonas fluminis]|uniref:TetR family transcriptional regulator n=1 Tax=Solimonas fluminis TaxID=2086571 RepID=A0A2S5TJE5_9GAMM|nr:TetR/AcrR family transcriptional regulator [Solimonas fluminis]PPE75085.1 TetR family transcriptional regulator [Solimonas fluminis]